ncbi:hypothetical protein G9A89_022419 [Geosiphon pyriformis]|nr:hypothetical protein G9A89_022419 [Geosiphon pyriformis]
MIYTISEEEEPISRCTSESESIFNLNSNSDNDNNKNNSFSSTQWGNEKYSNLNANSNPETYITLFDLTKEQELKWFSNNNKGIMPERAHDTDARFDLRYLRKDPIKLELHSCTCIDLKVALEISATIMVQLVFRSSLAKKGINIKKRIIDAEYIKNIIVMLQNDSKKTYIIDPNEKIAQAIFLSLVKIAQLVLIRNRKELGITTRGIQGFRSTSKIDILVNMAEKEIVNKREIISIHQPISILPYDQYIVVIEKKVKDQTQIFEAEATLCESRKIGLQDTTQTTLFELVYGKTATLPVEIEVNTYPTEPITEDNLQKMLLKRTYNLMKTLENKQQRAADNIQKSQKIQKEKHDNQLPDKPVEFKIEDKVHLYHTKVEKQ